MKTAHRRAARSKHELLAANPIARAVHIARVDETYRDKTTTSRIDMFMRTDGTDATDLLATLAVVIGSTCQLAAILGHYEADHRVKLLHGALRTIQMMCLQGGYKWQAAYAPALCNAMDIADQLGRSLRGTPEQVAQAAADAEWFADQITQHTITPDAVLTHERAKP